MKVLFVGPGRCGKDTAVEWCGKYTTLRPAGTFSLYLLPEAAAALGQTPEEAYATRHLNREVWRRVGDELRERDGVTVLCRRAFAVGDVSGGIRALPEVRGIRDERLADWVVWIDRDVPVDPTLEFGPEEADFRVSNEDTIEKFHARLYRLFKPTGVLTC